ncbi:unnamed protein product [Trichogramma brassicae]|uniref:Uncharacterized protein n=1 Tax=Trichogramma brassicae TaxID=86971 RepID=A0A6H5IXX2_9HYME|nr:unnamed protein product [Trichogramma brassicae]
MREEVKWEIEEERREFLDKLYPLIREWEGQLPNLRDIFRCQEIDWLITEELKNPDDALSCEDDETYVIVAFVIRAGYKDEPDLDEDGKPLFRRRTTALNYATEHGDFWPARRLFEIYDRFDANYVNENGWTHFHVACEYGLDDVVEKFLELGQDPDCKAEETMASNFYDPPLISALFRGHKKVAELLLTYGANPQSVSLLSYTPLHIMCLKNFDDESFEFVKLFFEINDRRQQAVSVNAKNYLDQTPLHVAVCKSSELAKFLLKRGAVRI